MTAASAMSIGTDAFPVSSSAAIEPWAQAAGTSAATIIRWRDPRSASAPPKSWKSSCEPVALAITYPTGAG